MHFFIQRIEQIWLIKKATMNGRMERLKIVYDTVVWFMLFLFWYIYIFIFFFGLDRLGVGGVGALATYCSVGCRGQNGQTDTWTHGHMEPAKMRTQTRAEFIKTHRIRTGTRFDLHSVALRQKHGTKPPEPEASHETWAQKPHEPKAKKNTK